MKTNRFINLLACGALALAVSGCGKKESASTATTAPAEQPAASTSTASTAAAPAATQPAQAASNSSAQGQRKLVKIATIEGVDKNTEFQRNLNLINKQKQLVIAIKSKLEQTTDADEKAKLQDAMEKTLAKLNENNQKMFEAYGFTLTRNYSYVIEKSLIYMAVSEQEAEKIVSK